MFKLQRATASVRGPTNTVMASRRTVALRHMRITAQQGNPDKKDDMAEYDLVTRMVAKVFGKKAVMDPAPMGLQRIDWSKAVDQFAVTDRDAEPVETDTEEMKLIRPLLAGTQLEKEPLRMAFDADSHGWNPRAFHEKVDGYGAAIVFARTEGGAVIGGYNPSGYDGYGEKTSMGAFLFCWPDGDLTKKPYKLPKIEVPQLAMIDKLEAGPQFGPGDLKILMQKPNERQAYCKLVDYARPPDGRKTMFAPGEKVRTQLVDLKVYIRKGGKLKYELEGLRWKSSYTEEGDPAGTGPPPGIVGGGW